MTIELIKENEIQETCDMVARACKNSVFAEFYPQQPKYFSIAYDEIKQKAEYGHFYVVKECGKIIGCRRLLGQFDGKLDKHYFC